LIALIDVIVLLFDNEMHKSQNVQNTPLDWAKIELLFNCEKDVQWDVFSRRSSNSYLLFLPKQVFMYKFARSKIGQSKLLANQMA